MSVRLNFIDLGLPSSVANSDNTEENPNPIKKANKWLASPPVIPILAWPNFASEIWVRPSGSALPIDRKTFPK